MSEFAPLVGDLKLAVLYFGVVGTYDASRDVLSPTFPSAGYCAV